MQRSQTWARVGRAYEEESSHDPSPLRVTYLEELDGRAQEASQWARGRAQARGQARAR